MVLSPGFKALAKKLQEAATAMSHSDIRARLSDTLSDLFKNTGAWAYILDIFGDDTSGNVVYTANGDIFQAPYTCSKSGATIDTANAVDVVPLTMYVPETDAGGLMEAGARHSKGDLTMLQTMHDHSVKLGASCATTEAGRKKPADLTLLTEAATGIEPLRLIESDQAAFEPVVKIISAGRGSSGYYSKEVLQRDGPKIFKRGTLMYLNHATAAEEAARPEGDYSKLAAVLTEDAAWNDAGKDGAGLYSRSKVFAGVAQEVKEKAPWTGVSIRAYGTHDANAIAPDGKPGVITALNHAESVDLVTKAGRDGKLLLESAGSPAPKERETGMDEAQVKALIEAGNAPLVAENRKLRERLSLQEAAGLIDKQHGSMDAPPAVKARVRGRLLEGSMPKTATGELDAVALAALVEKDTKDEQAYVAGLIGGGVRGVGAAPAGAVPVELSEADFEKEMTASLMREGMTEAAAKAALKGQVN